MTHRDLLLCRRVLQVSPSVSQTDQIKVVFLPALCQKMGAPFAIVKGQARLSKLVHLKTATTVAITEVRSEDRNELVKLVGSVRSGYMEEHTGFQRRWGRGIMGVKA